MIPHHYSETRETRRAANSADELGRSLVRDAAAAARPLADVAHTLDSTYAWDGEYQAMRDDFLIQGAVAGGVGLLRQRRVKQARVSRVQPAALEHGVPDSALAFAASWLYAGLEPGADLGYVLTQVLDARGLGVLVIPKEATTRLQVLAVAAVATGALTKPGGAA